ncbi:DM13 domain-containing protein [uncultured Tateyamaria sp.]|uniref:DM13 domain-containing protein n=1 Tax=uncultured Tateyamaria sp. TaxID=455651 RepID=UPI00260D2107|nr:DM13 domain-containing protein [uncultured Tateyamaria sp.]
MKFFSTALIAITAATISFSPVLAGDHSSVASGTFTGASDHITTGGVQIIKTADGGAVVILDTDFSLDGAPDPRVGFGNDGTYVDVTDLGELQQLTGLQIYIVPPTVNVDDFNEVYIWCKQFSVPLGVAGIS